MISPRTDFGSSSCGPLNSPVQQSQFIWVFEDGRIELDRASRQQVLKLQREVDDAYAAGQDVDAVILEVRLENLLETIESDLAEAEGQDDDRIYVGEVDSDMAEYDSANPDFGSELVNLHIRWNSGTEPWLKSDSKDFPTFVRHVFSGQIRDHVSDTLIRDAAAEAVQDYERRCGNFRSKMSPT